jgi:UDP-N-acetylglucosamine acyltransferase
MGSQIHETAIVHSGAKLGRDVVIGPFCRVGEHVEIGDRTVLHSHVVLEGHTRIGSDNVFFPFSVIGAVPQDLKYRGEDTRVVMGNGNTIRESVTINLGTQQGGGVTQVGDQNLLMATVHLGHDATVGSHCILANGTLMAGHSQIGDYVTLGGMTGVQQFVRVGSHAYIGGQSGLERDVPPFSIVVGQRPPSIKGANIVGLRRRGFSAETITKINEALKLWVRPDVQREQCLLEIESQYGDSAEIQTLILFIRSSESGVVR